MPSSSPPARRRRSGSPSKSRGGASGGLTASATAAAESKHSKLITRTVWGLVMFFYLLFVLYRGHGLVCLNVFIAQCEIFREMVNVRYNNRKKEVPWFRSLQWAWFAVAVIYFYGGPMIKGISLNNDVDWRWYEAEHKKVAFLVYSFVFVWTVLAMKKGEYRYQMNQLAWTILTLIMVVAQMQSVILNSFRGLIWFIVPTLLVIINDSMAYFAGFTMGRKLIDPVRYPFLKLSPNKTWEGFIGGGIATIIMGYYLPLFFTENEWFVCPTKEMGLFNIGDNHCEIGAEFKPYTYTVPVGGPVRWLPGLIGMDPAVEIYSADELQTLWKQIGMSFWLYPQWQTQITVVPVQLYCLFLATFASMVAPFGGFFASAIKRAYDAKDFDTFIPGHGGLMDRLDCQFIMGLCTYTFHSTFCGPSAVESAASLMHAARQLTPEAQQHLLRELTKEVTVAG